MKEVFKHKYLTRYYHEELGIVEGKWTDDGSMSDSEYREIMMGTLESTQKYKPYGILIDARQFHLSIVPETQEWVQATVFVKAQEAGLKKVAFVLPNSIFVEVSIDQTMHKDSNEEIFVTCFFNDHDKAMSWLTKREGDNTK